MVIENYCCLLFTLIQTSLNQGNVHGRFLVIFKVAHDHHVPAVVTKLKPCVPYVARWFSSHFTNTS
jgi:hypothetical protein